MVYFADYTASLDALAAGKVDINAQTLNDTLFGVAAGSEQTIIVVGDNSTGNDAIICDESITSVADLEGKTVGAEEGVVDHFLLLQGLAEEDMTQDDIDFVGRQDRCRGGRVRRRRVRLRRRVRPLHRPGARARGLPRALQLGRLPRRHPRPPGGRDQAWSRTGPRTSRRWSTAGTPPSTCIEEDPEGTTAIMAEKAGLSPEEYDDLAEGTTLFDAEDALDAFEDRADDPTSLPEMARRINPFLLESGLVEGGGPARRALRPAVHPGLRGRQRVTTVDQAGARPAADVVGDPAPAVPEGCCTLAARGAGRPPGCSAIRTEIPAAWRIGVRRARRGRPRSPSGSGRLEAAARRLIATPGASWSAFAGMVGDGTLPDRPVGLGRAGGRSATRSRC